MTIFFDVMIVVFSLVVSLLIALLIFVAHVIFLQITNLVLVSIMKRLFVDGNRWRSQLPRGDSKHG